MLNKYISYLVLVLTFILIGLLFVIKTERASHEAKTKLLSNEIETKSALIYELNQNLNQMQLEADRLRKERQLVSEINLKYQSDLDQIERQFELELDTIRKLRHSNNETVKVWIDTDLPADVVGLLKYTRTESYNLNSYHPFTAAARLPATLPGNRALYGGN